MQEADVVQLGLRVNGQFVDALARIVRRAKAPRLGREMVDTLRGELDRQVCDLARSPVISRDLPRWSTP